MKKLTLAEWERKWIVGPVERFDQKYIMFSRWSWEPEMRKRLKDWRFTGEVTDKPGYELRDLALRRASRAGTQLSMYNMSKPNPSRFARAFSQAMKEARKAALLPGQTPSMDAAELVSRIGQRKPMPATRNQQPVISRRQPSTLVPTL